MGIIHITPMQLKTLQEIKKWQWEKIFGEDIGRGPYQYELGERMNKSQSTMKNHLHKLKVRGFISFSRSAGSITITPLGESILE